MNVFEDLIVELKQENLLENTVIEAADDVIEDMSHLETTEVPNRPSLDDDVEHAHDSVAPDASIETLAPENPSSEYDLALDPPAVATTSTSAEANADVTAPADPEKPIKVKNGKEFFKKRAVAEVSSLQMVEHVLTGVEREYLKLLPKTYDDFGAKKALNAFLRCDEDVNSQAHAEAEFALMQETEAWCSALAERDKCIPVASLRQYCEKSRPALSSQAMLAIARFYRNLPYSETVRAKFDFVITRLFSRPSDFEKRTALFGRDETLAHINTLYNDWSSIPLYSAEDDDSKIMLTALSFDDMAVEAENASNFDQLIESEFFGRLRMFKESISELFFAPSVTAAAIESNIRVGNAYVALIESERQKLDAKSLQLKYGSFDYAAVSDTTGRSLELVDILRDLGPVTVERPAEITPTAEVRPVEMPAVREKRSEEGESVPKKSFLSGIIRKSASVNKWFLMFAVLLVAASLGVWVWANYFVTPDPPSVSVKGVEFNGAPYQEHIKLAKLSGENLYVQLQPSWDSLPKEKRQEILQAIYKTSGDKGFTQVNLIGKDGKFVGFASANRLEVVMP